MACAELFSEKCWEEIPRDNFTVVEISEAFQIKNSENIKEEDLNGHLVKVKTQFGETQSAVRKSKSYPPQILEAQSLFLFKKMIAERLRKNDRSAILVLIPPEDAARNLACYNGKYIVQNGRLIIPVECGGWKNQSSPFLTVIKRQILSGEIFYQN